nr:hypothetical protein [Tanacetum cinerariifolium]
MRSSLTALCHQGIYHHTTPLECDKRRKKTRDKECSGPSSSETIESSHLEAMDTTRKIYEKVMAEVRKCHTRMKVNDSQRDVIEGNFQNIFSALESQRDTTIATFQKSLDEHVARVARREDPQDIIRVLGGYTPLRVIVIALIL